MVWLFFCAFVVVVALTLLAAGLVAHLSRLRNATGWWGGVIISVTMFLLAQPFFESLPEKVVSYQVGCNVGYRQQVETDWDAFAAEVVNVNVLFVLAGFVLCLLALEVLQGWLNMPEKLIAFIFLALAFGSLSTLLYVFLIRKLTYLIFSFVLGTVIAIPIHIAFFARLEDWKTRISTLR